jgi:transketolase
MRPTFAKLLYDEMQKDKLLYCLTADLGYKMFDKIRDNFPNNFFNVGAAEQLMIGLAIGLSYEGYIPICYSITPFLLARPFEIIRNYINLEKIPIKLVGSGRNKEYKLDGFSHWAEDDKIILNCFPNIKSYFPKAKEDLKNILGEFLYSNSPAFLSLSKNG